MNNKLVKRWRNVRFLISSLEFCLIYFVVFFLFHLFFFIFYLLDLLVCRFEAGEILKWIDFIVDGLTASPNDCNISTQHNTAQHC